MLSKQYLKRLELSIRSVKRRHQTLGQIVTFMCAVPKAACVKTKH